MTTTTTPPPPYRRYHCIYCWHAVPSLVRRRGPDDLQLLPCAACGAPALDPYLEREFLCLAMDLFCLRRPAVRHVLCHRWAADSEHQPSLMTLAGVVILVRTHLCRIATPERRPVHLPIGAYEEWIHGGVVSALGVLVPLVVCHLVVCSGVWGRNPSGGAGLVSTALVYGATDVMHLWENSETVRQIGSVFLLIHQYLALWTMFEQQQQLEMGMDKKMRRRGPPPAARALCCGLFILLLRGMVMELYWTLVVVHDVPTPLPCPGFYWTFDRRWGICLV
jgi:Arv1-like family